MLPHATPRASAMFPARVLYFRDLPKRPESRGFFSCEARLRDANTLRQKQDLPRPHVLSPRLALGSEYDTVCRTMLEFGLFLDEQTTRVGTHSYIIVVCVCHYVRNQRVVAIDFPPLRTGTIRDTPHIDWDIRIRVPGVTFVKLVKLLSNPTILLPISRCVWSIGFPLQDLFVDGEIRKICRAHLVGLALGIRTRAQVTRPQQCVKIIRHAARAKTEKTVAM